MSILSLREAEVTQRNFDTALLLADRGEGKTLTSVYWLVNRALLAPDQSCAFFSANEHSRDVEQQVVEMVRYLFPDTPLSYSQTQRLFQFPNHSRLWLRDGNQPDRQRGFMWHWLVFDEFNEWVKPQHETAYNVSMIGLRLGDQPKALVNATYHSTRLLLHLMRDRHTVLVDRRKAERLKMI